MTLFSARRRPAPTWRSLLQVLGMTAGLAVGVAACDKPTPAPAPPPATPAPVAVEAPPRVLDPTLVLPARPATGVVHDVLLLADGQHFQMLPPTLTAAEGDAIRFRVMSGTHILIAEPYGVLASDSAAAQFRANTPNGAGPDATPVLAGNGTTYVLSLGGFPSGLYRLHSSAYTELGAKLDLTILPRAADAGASTPLPAGPSRTP